MHCKLIPYLVFLLIIPLASAFSQIEIDVFKEQMQKNIQQHNIKSQTTWNHAYKGNTPDPEGYKNAVLSYDQEGNLTEEIKYNSNGNVFMMETFDFNQLNLNTGYVRFDGKENKITFKRMLKYDKDGNRLAEAGFDGIVNYRNQYTYQDGQLKSIYYYTGTAKAEGEPHQKRIFEYKTPQHRVIKVYDGQDKYLFKLEQRFDGQDNIIEDTEFEKGNNDRIVKQFKYAYNQQNQITKEERYQSGELQYKREYHYNAAGLLEKITQQPSISAKPFDLKIFEYTPAGQLKKEYYRRKSSQEFSSKEYTYDTRGICKEEISYYASYKYRVLFKYEYEFY